LGDFVFDQSGTVLKQYLVSLLIAGLVVPKESIVWITEKLIAIKINTINFFMIFEFNVNKHYHLGCHSKTSILKSTQVQTLKS